VALPEKIQISPCALQSRTQLWFSAELCFLEASRLTLFFWVTKGLEKINLHFYIPASMPQQDT